MWLKLSPAVRNKALVKIASRCASVLLQAAEPVHRATVTPQHRTRQLPEQNQGGSQRHTRRPAAAPPKLLQSTKGHEVRLAWELLGQAMSLLYLRRQHEAQRVSAPARKRYAGDVH